MNRVPITTVIRNPERSVCIIDQEEVDQFLNLILVDPVICKFLRFDKCYKYADKYLLSMTFVYFKRCHFALNEYSRTNFFCCLYLAHDIEEDDEDLKYEIFPWALGIKWRDKISSFLQKKECLWARMHYRAIVGAKCCDDLLAIFACDDISKRTRQPHHGGAKRAYLKSPLSNMPKGPKLAPRKCRLCDQMDDTSGTIPTLFSYPRKSFGYNDSGTDGVYSQDGESYVDNEISYEDETWLSQETFTSDNNFGLITAKNKEESFVAGEE
ncbi:Speedy protein A [Echinococcus granulosus]|nr:Speedy protein A [Echinococcus granulosus]